MKHSQTSNYWEGGLLYEPMANNDDFDVHQRTEDGIEWIGSVTRFSLYMQEPFWQAVSPDGDIYRPYDTKTLAAQALTKKRPE
jgi:hypothetical protein